MPRDGSDTKERIERAALELFVERGIAETSVKEIARAADVSQGALYVHYPSKEQLAWALFSAGFTAFGSELRQIAHDHAGLEDKLRAMVRHVFARFDADWVPVAFVFLARHQHLRRVTQTANNPYTVFRGVVAEAIKAGQVPAQELDVAASLVIGAIIQVIDTRILGVIEGDLAPRADRVARACACLLQG